MSPSFSLVATLLLLSVLVYRYLLYPSLVSPLSKIPNAHPLCCITPKWFERERKQGRELKALFAAHETHGPIVRIAPEEISVVSLEGLRNVYTAGLIKHPWYKAKFENYATPNLVSMLDHRSHSIQKRMITSIYAKSYIQRSEDVARLSERILSKHFGPLLREYAKEGRDVNVMETFQSAGIDFMTAYIFGTAHKTSFLVETDRREAYFKEWTKIRDFDELGKKNLVESTCMELLEATITDRSDQAAAGETKPVVFSVLYEQLREKATGSGTKLADEELNKRFASEVLDHIIAAHETFAITLTYAVHCLSQDPPLQASLRAELLTLEPVRGDVSGRELPPADTIDSLPLLTGILYETLRLYAAVAGRQPRIVPPEGIVLHGHQIPGGTTVSSNAYCMHRHEDAFPRRFEWLPQRWLPYAKRNAEARSFPSSEEARRWFWAFGSGGRM